jgi:hypothetical protein
VEFLGRVAERSGTHFLRPRRKDSHPQGLLQSKIAARDPWPIIDMIPGGRLPPPQAAICPSVVSDKYASVHTSQNTAKVAWNRRLGVRAAMRLRTMWTPTQTK